MAPNIRWHEDGKSLVLDETKKYVPESDYL